ncbi:PREDICTED: coiled-coil domain-containing protein 174 [Drosophila arizonae]|uniref:Coiled-coil domain-containing protein 174 n=1 Tax=Drosophila arizonae TaxID=7263 RepID=A0ABM1Q5L4_DROAR|nr:PREDICTED: coiled-coil domain-containing protein 174 [Drosophila arizonae]
MNDPNKAISVNLSSLLSLKAELQRKQHEVKMAKESSAVANKFRPSKIHSKSEKSSRSSNKDGKYVEISRNDDVKVYESEDFGQLDKSRRVLEAKSKYYDQMTRSGGSLNSDDNCLVMFNRKRQEQHRDERQQHPSSPPHRKISRSSSENEDEGNSEAGNDDDEVEYTDCLGRTRTCLRKDLKEALRRDKQLADSMPERLDQTKANWLINTKGTHDSDPEADDDEPSFGPKPTESVYSEALSTMTKHDEQRANWERKEQENIDKPNVHYQDVFFDEARTHGVGYYAFSTDEEERMQQQRELEKARQETQAEQKRHDDLRAERDRIIAARVLAAKNRIRARNGLPEISKEEYEKELQLKASKAEIEARELEREQTEEEAALAKQKAADEAEREKLRRAHVRDWDKDKGKSGIAKNTDDNEQLAAPVEWQYKPERLPMSQEEWNEQQRAVRAPEFAPMPELEVAPKRLNFSSVPPTLSTWNGDEQEFSSYHSTQREKHFQRRNYTKSNDDLDAEEPIASTSSLKNHGTAIPPPDCLVEGFTGPSAAKRVKSQAELERSIEAGLRFLRENCDKGVLGSKTTWTSKADY